MELIPRRSGIDNIANVVNQVLIKVSCNKTAHHKTRIYLIVDTSGSMEQVMGNVQTCIAAMVDGMLPKWKISIIKFNHGQEVHSLTSNKGELHKIISDMEAKGQTDIEGAFDAFIGEYEEVDNAFSICIFISDGRDSTEGKTKQLVSYVKKMVKIPIVSVGFGYDYDEILLSSIGVSYYHVKDENDMIEKLGAIIGLIKSVTAHNVLLKIEAQKGTCICDIGGEAITPVKVYNKKIPYLVKDKDRFILIGCVSREMDMNGKYPYLTATLSTSAGKITETLDIVRNENTEENIEVMVEISRILTVKAMKRALELKERGKTEKAKKILRELMADIKQRNNKTPHKEYEKYKAKLKVELSRLDSEERDDHVEARFTVAAFDNQSGDVEYWTPDQNTTVTRTQEYVSQNRHRYPRRRSSSGRTGYDAF